MTDERRLDCPICELPLANALRRYLDGIPAHASCVRVTVSSVSGPGGTGRIPVNVATGWVAD